MRALPDLLLDPVIRSALQEDLGQAGDITCRLVVPEGARTEARLVARAGGVASGLQVARRTFEMLDPTLEITGELRDGEGFATGDVLMSVRGDVAAILTAERVALNFLGRLCGIATMTAEFVAEVEAHKARITCTRKTTPGLRLLEKQAVLHGGGANHRFGLGDAVMIKDNHIAAAGGIAAVLERARLHASHMTKVEIEVDTLAQLDEVLAVGGADVVLLDNMDTADMAEAVEKVNGRLVLEASGNMRLERVAAVAATGVDYISVGALTHSAQTLDIGLDIDL